MIPNHLKEFFTSYQKNLILKHKKEPHLEHFLKDLESSFRWTSFNMLIKVIECKDGSAILMFDGENSSDAYFGYTTFYNYTNDSDLWKKIIHTCKKMNIDFKALDMDFMVGIRHRKERNFEAQFKRALSLLKKHKKKLIQLADYLLEKEVIFKEDLIRIFGERPFKEIPVKK